MIGCVGPHILIRHFRTMRHDMPVGCQRAAYPPYPPYPLSATCMSGLHTLTSHTTLLAAPWHRPLAPPLGTARLPFGGA